MPFKPSFPFSFPVQTVVDGYFSKPRGKAGVLPEGPDIFKHIGEIWNECEEILDYIEDKIFIPGDEILVPGCEIFVPGDEILVVGD